MAVTWVEPLVNWLSVYVYRGVPLLSLSMHLILATFSESRRREDRGWKRLLVWVAYQLTDWGPAYVIGNLYLETSPREKMIVAFWVPFLLLHHARPDNISAYTIEDSELWIRLMVSVLPKSVGSICIVYRFILTDCAADWLLRWASGIMLFLGIWKYLESAAALWLSNLAHIRDLRWLSKKQTDISVLKDDDEEATDDEALLVAHDLFEICKGAFCDYTVGVDHKAVTTMFSGRWESMCTVVEMELSLMYDILYTKAAMVHTWHGYTIRLASPPLTATALLLFVLHCKEGMEPVDKAISYTLLSMTFLLDVRWLFRALASSWTHLYFKHRPHSLLKHEFWCQERWKKLRGFVVSLCLSQLSLWLWAGECGKERPFRNKCDKEPKSYRRWAGTFGQCNLLDQCAVGNRHNLHSIPTRLAIESGYHLRSRGLALEDHSRGTEIPDYVKKLVFSNICGVLFPKPVAPTDPEQTTNTDTPGPSGPGNPPTDPEDSRGPATPKNLGTPGPGNPPTGPTDPGGDEGIVTTSWPPGPGSPSQGTGSTGPKQPKGTVPRWLLPGELPDHCTCVYPVSPNPDDRCNGIHDHHPLWLHYPRPRGWICTGVGIQAAPWPLYPREQICIGINNEPPRLPCPWQVHAGTGNAPFEEHIYNAPARPYDYPAEQSAEDHWRYDYEQARAGMRNAPFDENIYDVPARPYGHLEERVAEGHWRYDYEEQAPSESYEQAEHRVYGVNRLVLRQDTPNTAVQHGDEINKPLDSDEDMWFPPELQEVILIWHIATDVFLSCITGEGMYKEVPTRESIELGKAIEQMSDYMLFLVAKRSEMLPGLKLSSLYKNAEGALKKIHDIKAASEGCKQYTSSATDEKEQLAKWMPENMERLKDPDTDIIWEGTRLARVLLRLVPQDVQPKWSVTAEEVTGTEKKLECWVPDLKDRTSGSMKGMLEFILDAWVRLLLYASMRCSRDSHAKQLSRGGELTTLVWIITEHAKISFVKKQLPLLFPQKEKTQ